MKYSLQLNYQRSGSDFFRIGYYRTESQPNGLTAVRYLGATAIVVPAPELSIPSLDLRMLDQFAQYQPQIDRRQTTIQYSLDILTQKGIAVWNELLAETRPLSARTALAENRIPIPGGKIPLGDAALSTDKQFHYGFQMAGAVDEFSGYVALPSEIEAIERVERHALSLIAASEGPMPGNYL